MSWIRDYVSTSPAAVEAVDDLRRERLSGARLGRGYAGWKAVLLIVGLLTFMFVVANYLGQAARDAEPRPTPTSTIPGG